MNTMLKYLMKFKNTYDLQYIEKLFKFIPLIFILISTLISLLITYLILETKEKRDIDLLVQKNKIHFEYEKKSKLNSFVTSLYKDVEDELDISRESIKKHTYKIIGNLNTQLNNKDEFEKINIFLNKYEKVHNISITIFEKENLNIIYGKENIDYLKGLIFAVEEKKYKNLVLKYISSQGKNNLQSWKNDLKGTIRFSFFDILKINNKEYYIGSFSNIENIKAIIKSNLFNKIKEIKSNQYDIWFLDLISKESYNFSGNDNLLKNKDIKFEESHNYKIHNFYVKNEYENREFEDMVYFNSLYNYIIVIDYYLNYETKTILIKEKYDSLFYNIVKYILILSVLFTLFSFFFSKFIKNILERYNVKLQQKTDSLTHWKNRFELAIIASNDGLWDIDFSTNKIYFSKKWLEISGYDKNEILEFSDWFSLIHNEDKPKVNLLFEKILNSKSETFICEYRLKTKNDGYKWILGRGRIFQNKKRMLMMSMDIDKSKRMKKELLDVELLTEDGNIVIFKLNNDKDLSVKYMSSSIKTYGFSKDDFENGNINFIDLIYKEDINIVKVAFNATLKNQLKDFAFVCRALNTQGKIRWISCRLIIIKNHSGDVINFYGYINDITKIKVSQEELKLKVELELSKNKDKEKLLIQQSKLAAMGEMIGSIAHQWRQPLNNVSLILQFLRDNYANKDIKVEKLNNYFSRANTQLNYMSDTIDDFRNFYKPSKSINEFSINNAIENSLDIIKSQLKEANIEISLSSNDYIIINYENEFKQSLLNIFNNAIDAILSKSKLTKFKAYLGIEVFDINESIKIEISNNGSGISEEIISRIFEPYFTTKFETQGTGIGLYITKTIIENNMRGKIEVTSLEDEVKFIIILPKNISKEII